MTSETTKTRALVTTMAYVIGVKEYFLESHYSHNEEETSTLEKLRKNKSATIIRSLCLLRTAFMTNFLRIEQSLDNLKNIKNMKDYINDECCEAIEFLESQKIEIVLYNKRAQDYCNHINALIAQHVNNIKDIFPDEIEWNYIKELIVVPRYSVKSVAISEYEKFQGNRDRYPFQCYIHWDMDKLQKIEEERGVGTNNLLSLDIKFASVLYNLHDTEFSNKLSFIGAADSTKESIYDFIADADKVDIIIDCENVAPLKFFCMMKALKPSEIGKIRKITLFDDKNTGEAWTIFQSLWNLNIERIEVDRLIETKSVVDMRLALGCQNAYLSENVDSFILVASDSDYWTLISTLKQAKFYVIGESEKCSVKTRAALDEHGIDYCFLETFGEGNAMLFKKFVLMSKIKEYGASIIGKNCKQLIADILKETHLDFTDKEVELFYTQYIKTITLKIDGEGYARLVYKEVK